MKEGGTVFLFSENIDQIMLVYDMTVKLNK